MRGRLARGYDRWQLPTRRLLFFLISHQYENPSLPKGHPFENVFTGYYWTGETCRWLPDQAWYGHLGGSRIHRGMKHGSYMVWPLSPASEIVAPKHSRFMVDGACVHDAWTLYSRDVLIGVGFKPREDFHVWQVRHP
jgi:hypothetical protein